MPPALRIIRKSSFTPKPWKNGGGVTYEAIRVPAEGEAFAWRVSVARIEHSGPFSEFAGYARKMVLLEGDGLKLEFVDGGERRLERVGDLAEFEGAPAPQCTLLGGACVDFNLMVAKAHAVEVGVERLAGKEAIEASATSAECTLIFGIDAALELNVDRQTFGLEPGDLALVSNGRAQVTASHPRPAANPSAVFLATINHSLLGP